MKISNGAVSIGILLPRALRFFHEENPGVRVQLYDMSTREILRGLRDGKLEVALLIEVPPKVLTGIVFKELRRYGVWLATHPAHPLARARKVSLAQVANEEVGLALQRTSPTIAGIFVRGLVGNKVAVYVDGVRYTTSAMRGGINTFLDLNDPTNFRAVEVLRGPNGAQYGSDSIGGTVQLVSRTPDFGYAKPETHGEVSTFFNSADLSYGGNTLISYGTQRFGLLVNVASRRINTLRTSSSRR